MNKPVIIFGTGDIAQLAHYYFTHDSDATVAAFTVDQEYLTGNTFCNLPVVAFEDIHRHYPPDSHQLFIALSYSRLNGIRKEKYLQAKARGYTLASYVSSRATVLNERRIGDNCFILENNTLQPFATIGNNVTLWSGNHIGHHASIQDHCFIASHVVISGGVVVGDECFIGVNATLRDHISVGEKSVIGAGALVMQNAAPHSVFIGPATAAAGFPSSRLNKL